MPSRLATLLLASALLTGCGYFQFPGIHRVEVQQGNIITQDMVDQLRPGMTKSQVRYIMGTPLVADSFHQNRWDYYYSIKKADGEMEREQMTLYFSDGKLSNIRGDYLPSGAKAEQEEADDAEG
ncbi:MAG: outer membrane protein assembly factor BamE [Porticoccaceae bacterium]|jgi:outer membrane protein assembly factor BamE|nr:outer membrane protein assembly factor BamE [Porticoccaceae bacterium]MEA3298986.1 outer membrane protein assembly factor BamE [Pseudomonadota bacterium]HLS99504.1 outer membrane protein assembly factor BamE [Porticoccaceae bacterium]